jgi:hypothetical protein
MLERRLNLIGYVRVGDSLVSEIEQLNAIKDYCRIHKHRCLAVYTDSAQPAFGLTRALDSLKKVDGLIAYDASRLVNNVSDSYRELRPLVESRFMHGHKKLITIADGFENVTAAGQENLMNMLNEWHDRREMPNPTYDASAHEIYFVNQTP